jgi:2'-hydroxyisoflavone reductase
VIVDNSGYVPRHVRDSAELLKDRCGRYIYTSTVAVYDFEKTPLVDINSPMHASPPWDVETVTGETYGPLKAACDRIAQDILGDKFTSVRPTYIIGPGDTTDRFTYWVDRFHRGGDIVCPNAPTHAAAWVDVHDLCHWLVELGEQDTAGIFNAITPDERVTREQVMHGIKATTSVSSTLHWPDAETLEEFDFSPPMFGVRQPDRLMDSSHAKRAGLQKTPLAETVNNIWEWWSNAPSERRADPRRWPTAERESAILKKIKA